MVFEVFALVMIPINSFNPVFYSELYKKVVQMIWIKGRLVVSCCAPNNTLNDTENEEDQQKSEEKD